MQRPRGPHTHTRLLLLCSSTRVRARAQSQCLHRLAAPKLELCGARLSGRVVQQPHRHAAGPVGRQERVPGAARAEAGGQQLSGTHSRAGCGGGVATRWGAGQRLAPLAGATQCKDATPRAPRVCRARCPTPVGRLLALPPRSTSPCGQATPTCARANCPDLLRTACLHEPPETCAAGRAPTLLAPTHATLTRRAVLGLRARAGVGLCSPWTPFCGTQTRSWTPPPTARCPSPARACWQTIRASSCLLTTCLCRAGAATPHASHARAAAAR